MMRLVCTQLLEFAVVSVPLPPICQRFPSPWSLFRTTILSLDPGKIMLKSQELDEYRGILNRIQARLRGDVEQLEEEALSGGQSGNDPRSSNHMAEMGSDAWDVDFSLHLVENDQEVMKEISAALKRIDAGTFGRCEGCLAKGLPELRSWIPRSRLRAIPYTRNCVECERVREEHR